MRLNAACIHTLPVVLRNDMAGTCTYVRTLCLAVTYKDYDLSVLQYGGERNACAIVRLPTGADVYRPRGELFQTLRHTVVAYLTLCHAKPWPRSSCTIVPHRLNTSKLRLIS